VENGEERLKEEAAVIVFAYEEFISTKTALLQASKEGHSCSSLDKAEFRQYPGCDLMVPSKQEALSGHTSQLVFVQSRGSCCKLYLPSGQTTQISFLRNSPAMQARNFICIMVDMADE
jgi:hypothetical protein